MLPCRYNKCIPIFLITIRIPPRYEYEDGEPLRTFGTKGIKEDDLWTLIQPLAGDVVAYNYMFWCEGNQL